MVDMQSPTAGIRRGKKKEEEEERRNHRMNIYWSPYYIGRPAAITKTMTTRMWADAHRDGRPAEYRWRTLFNAAKFA